MCHDKKSKLTNFLSPFNCFVTAHDLVMHLKSLLYKSGFLLVCIVVALFVINLDHFDTAGNFFTAVKSQTEVPPSPQLRTYYINNNEHRRLIDGEGSEGNNIDNKNGELGEIIITEGEDPEESSAETLRTATGGFVYILLVMLTMIAFVGNGAFLVNVFWQSK